MKFTAFTTFGTAVRIAAIDGVTLVDALVRWLVFSKPSGGTPSKKIFAHFLWVADVHPVVRQIPANAIKATGSISRFHFVQS